MGQEEDYSHRAWFDLQSSLKVVFKETFDLGKRAALHSYGRTTGTPVATDKGSKLVPYYDADRVLRYAVALFSRREPTRATRATDEAAAGSCFLRQNSYCTISFGKNQV